MTPSELRIDPKPDEELVRLLDECGNRIASFVEAEDATEVVRRYNAHAALVEACEKSEKLIAALTLGGHFKGSDVDECNAKLASALARASGLTVSDHQTKE